MNVQIAVKYSKYISQKGGTSVCRITGNVVEFTDIFDLGKQPDLTQGYFATCARRCGRTGIVGSTSTSFDLSEFFTFGRSVLLFRITVTKLYGDGLLSLLLSMISCRHAHACSTKRSSSRARNTQGVSAAHRWQSLYKRFNTLIGR